MTIKDAARRGLVGILVVLLVAPPGALGQLPPLSQPPPTEAPAPPIFRQEELDQFLAPIALYPDALLAQILMASTYPLEVVQALVAVVKAGDAEALAERVAPAVNSLICVVPSGQIG